MSQRRGRSLDRTRGTRVERSTILIITEGTKTEPEYFSGLKRLLSASGVEIKPWSVAPSDHPDPMSVVEAAHRRAGKLGRSSDFDQCWVVLDVDEHVHLQAALEKARRLGYFVALSNPCFEIWLLWHHKDYGRFIERSQLERVLSKLGIDGKSIPRGFPFDRYLDAARRSQRSCESGSWEHVRSSNPASNLHTLVHAMVP